MQAWEQAIFSGQPSREWIRQEPWPALSAVLHAGYLSYYFVVAAAPLGLWISGRRDGARRTIGLSMATFYLCYVVFLVFPVAGPRYLFPPAENAATAVAPARLARALHQFHYAVDAVAGIVVAVAVLFFGRRLEK